MVCENVGHVSRRARMADHSQSLSLDSSCRRPWRARSSSRSRAAAGRNCPSATCRSVRSRSRFRRASRHTTCARRGTRSPDRPRAGISSCQPQKVLDAVLRWDLARQDGGPRWRADGRGAEEVFKANSCGGETVEVGGGQLVVTGASHGPCALVVAEYEEYVGCSSICACHIASEIGCGLRSYFVELLPVQSKLSYR